MNNQEAIEVMFNEWKCIDRNDGINCDRKCESCDLVMDVQTIREAFNIAISALQAQEAKHSKELSPTHKALDTISRQAAIDAFEDTTFTKNEILRRLSELPPAHPVITCDGCRFVGTYDTDLPCCYCIRREKDCYEKE